MKKQEKIFEVENLTQKIKGAKSVALIDYRGITANQVNELRKLIKKTGGELQVVKNTLFARALVDAKLLGKTDDLALTDQTMALFANDDEISPIKAIANFAKPLSLLPFKMGFFGERTLSAEEVKRFASLPGKDELRAKLVGILNQQPQRLVYSLNFNLQKLVYILKRVSEKAN